MNYTTLNEQLTGRCKDRRKLANNTYAERRGDGEIAIRLHATDILTFHADGSVGVDTGGWHTRTTKDRLNEYLPNGYRIVQDRSQWYWVDGGNWAGKFHFSDGDTINAHGAVVSQAPLDAEDKNKAMLKRIDKYAKLYGKALPLDRPSGGDCFYCHLRKPDGKAIGDAMDTLHADGSVTVEPTTDHLLSHMDEGYVVPSLAYNAMQERGAGPAWYWTVFKGEDGGDKQRVFEKISGRNSLLDSARKEIVRWVRRYMRRRLGLAS